MVGFHLNLLAANEVGIVLASVHCCFSRPFFQPFLVFGIQVQGYLRIDFLKFFEETILVCNLCGRNDLHGLLDGIQLLRHLLLLLHPSVILPVHFGDLTQVTGTCGGDDVYFFRGT